MVIGMLRIPLVDENIKPVTCTHCSWVSMLVTREYANNQIKEFNEWFEKQSDATKKHYSNTPSTIKNYACLVCGKFGPYRDYQEGDCPEGCTIGPVIDDPNSN